MLSLLMPNFNNGRFIETAVKSVMAQSSSDWELIIVDDASADDSLERIQPFLSDRRIRLVRNDSNVGIGETLRIGVNASRGRVFGRLDPDDALHSQAVELMLRAHTDSPGYSMIYSTMFECDEDLMPMGVSSWPGPIRSSNLHEDQIYHFTTFSREAYDQTDGFDREQVKAVDKDIYYKMEEVAPAVLLPLALYFYRMHSGGISQAEHVRTACLYHARAYLRAYERRAARGIANVSRKEAAASLFRLGDTGLDADRPWARTFIRKAIELQPLNVRYLKTYVGRALLGLR